mmetsp:Transcript_17358/g.38525  ORF Transcript_17358/g.38525 Transcript_17358/m.38525 type:complete len:226 (-) Transcript_17358:126-803(-)
MRPNSSSSSRSSLRGECGLLYQLWCRSFPRYVEVLEMAETELAPEMLRSAGVGLWGKMLAKNPSASSLSRASRASLASRAACLSPTRASLSICTSSASELISISTSMMPPSCRAAVQAGHSVSALTTLSAARRPSPRGRKLDAILIASIMCSEHIRSAIEKALPKPSSSAWPKGSFDISSVKKCVRASRQEEVTEDIRGSRSSDTISWNRDIGGMVVCVWPQVEE